MEKFISKRITELCNERGLSYYALCKISDVAYSTISAVINNKNIPTVATLLMICNGLNISLSQFFLPLDKGADDVNFLNLWHKLNFSEKNLILGYMAGLTKTDIRKV